MNPPLEFALAIALPIAAFYAVIGGGRLLNWISEHRVSQHRAGATGSAPMQRVRANLVRLRAEVESTEARDDLLAKNMRLRAVRAAYVDSLYDACQRLDISPLQGKRAVSIRQSDIYQLETALRARGLDVREPAARS